MTETLPAEATIGHNNPPDPTPWELVQNSYADLKEEAEGWLDGEPIATQGQADSVSLLMETLRQSKNDADAARKNEAKPFDDGKKEVQQRYNPILDGYDGALDTCKKALKPWLDRLERERARIAHEAAVAAAQARADAAAAREAAAAQDTNLAAQEQADQLERAASKADKAAKKAAGARAHAKGGARATSLRSAWRGEITDLREVVMHYWVLDRELFRALAKQLVDADVASGKRSIPGTAITEDKVVV